MFLLITNQRLLYQARSTYLQTGLRCRCMAYGIGTQLKGTDCKDIMAEVHDPDLLKVGVFKYCCFVLQQDAMREIGCALWTSDALQSFV